MSLGSLFVFLVVQRCIRRLRLLFSSHARRLVVCPPPPSFWSCGCDCPSPSPSLSSSCGVCPRRIPRHWFSCPDPFVPSLSVPVSSCDIVFVVMAPLLFVVVPSPSSPYNLLVPPHGQVLVGVGWLWACRLGAVSW
jgi:hypothetical protein